MKRLFSAAISIRLRPSQIKISLNLIWLVVLPVGLLAIATIYIPIFGSFLSPVATGLATALIALLAALSLISHVLAHVCVARRSVSRIR